MAAAAPWIIPPYTAEKCGSLIHDSTPSTPSASFHHQRKGMLELVELEELVGTLLESFPVFTMKFPCEKLLVKTTCCKQDSSTLLRFTAPYCTF
jgi:hypothetical protein